MFKKLPVREFEWVSPKYYTEEFIKDIDENGDYGAILEVDVKYPKELINKHQDLAFLSERRKINKVEKLITITENKKKYIVHISALKQGLIHGLKLTKVKTVIEFKQEAWLKPYIDMNTKLRMKANNELEKDFFKLMHNSVFRKTMENVRNHRDIKLVTSQHKIKMI